VGTGYVGLVTAACLADWGHDVWAVDRDPQKIARLKAGEIPIYEPGLQEVVQRACAAGNLRFTTDLGQALELADVVFLGVGTPTLPGTNHADLSQLYQAVEEIFQSVRQPLLLVTKSTVPVGTAHQLRTIVEKAEQEGKLAPGQLEVASNPEFLREGSAVEDFMHPDRVIVGVESPRASTLLQDIYRPLTDRGILLLETDCASAELIKYAANAFLATKVTFINEMADVAEHVGADIGFVAKGIGLDHRIGASFLKPGPGFGGSCFPKDTRALAAIAQDCGAPSRIVDAVISANQNRMSRMIQRITRAADGSLRGKKIAVLGLTFKANTDDMRESVSLTIIPALLREGAVVQAFDPAGMREAKTLLPEAVHYANSPEDALRDCDVAVILTEWQVFRDIAPESFCQQMARPVVVDLRNIYAQETMKAAGVFYHSLGRPFREPRG
jgi:UDPglucose 6-dehydrogenase